MHSVCTGPVPSAERSGKATVEVGAVLTEHASQRPMVGGKTRDVGVSEGGVPKKKAMSSTMMRSTGASEGVLAGLMVSLSVIFALVLTVLYLQFDDTVPRPVIQPPAYVFSVMWSLLFSLGIMHAFFLTHSAVAVPSWTFAFAGAWALCGLWVPLFASKWYKTAGVVLALAFAVATEAARRTPRPTSVIEVVFVEAPYGLLAGWLGVAAVLGLAIAVPKCNDKVLLPVAAVVVSLVGVGIANPLACLPPLVVCIANTHDSMIPVAFAGQIVSLLGMLGAADALLSRE